MKRTYLIDTAEAQQVQDSLWVECHANGLSGAYHDCEPDGAYYGDPTLASEARNFQMAMGTLELDPLYKIAGIHTRSTFAFALTQGETKAGIIAKSAVDQFAIHVEE